MTRDQALSFAGRGSPGEYELRRGYTSLANHRTHGHQRSLLQLSASLSLPQLLHLQRLVRCWVSPAVNSAAGPPNTQDGGSGARPQPPKSDLPTRRSKPSRGTDAVGRPGSTLRTVTQPAAKPGSWANLAPSSPVIGRRFKSRSRTSTSCTSPGKARPTRAFAAWSRRRRSCRSTRRRGSHRWR